MNIKMNLSDFWKAIGYTGIAMYTVSAGKWAWKVSHNAAIALSTAAFAAGCGIIGHAAGVLHGMSLEEEFNNDEEVQIDLTA